MNEPSDLKRSSVQNSAAVTDEARQPNGHPAGIESRHPAAEHLTDATTKWLAGLPVEIQPVKLARDFPRVANKLCDLWKRPAQFDPYISELLFDQRGARQGFPLSVASELASLKAHYATVYPSSRSIWDTQFLT
jgi:hypothetical protein